MKGPVQMASFALLWNKIKISFHLTLEPWGISGHEWQSQMDYSQNSMNMRLTKWMSTFWNCGKLMRNKEPNGIYPLKYLFHSDHTFRWFSTIQFSLSVMSDSLGPHESQHSRHPCPSPTPGVHSNSCPLESDCYTFTSTQSFADYFLIQVITECWEFPVLCHRSLLAIFSKIYF